MLKVIGHQCCVRLHGDKSLTGFKLCATTLKNMQQGNIQQCWELVANDIVSVCAEAYGSRKLGPHALAS